MKMIIYYCKFLCFK